MIHFDVMDGHFVPNISIGIPVMESVRKVTRLPLDAHLMISEPARYVEAFVKAGANSISVHCEVCPDIPAMAKRIHDLGARASIGINPETDADKVLPFAEHLDMILVMSVHPGFGGQEFIPAALDKLRYIRRELKRRGLEYRCRDRRRREARQYREREGRRRQRLRLRLGIFGKPDYRQDHERDRAHSGEDLDPPPRLYGENSEPSVSPDSRAIALQCYNHSSVSFPITRNRRRGVAQPGQSTAFGTQESLVQIQSPRFFSVNLVCFSVYFSLSGGQSRATNPCHHN